MVAAVIFDLDGVLIDSESVWNEARCEFALERGGRWPPDATRAMMGMSSREWSRYMHEQLGVPLPPEQISKAVAQRLERLYREHIPLFPRARETVAALAQRWPMGLASSANRSIIELVLALGGMDRCFRAVVSSEEVPRGKPAPDVYLEAARRVPIDPTRCAAVEDSTNGLRSAAAAGMAVIAIPNREFPPEPEALALAHAVVHSLDELRPELVEGLTAAAQDAGQAP